MPWRTLCVSYSYEIQTNSLNFDKELSCVKIQNYTNCLQDRYKPFTSINWDRASFKGSEPNRQSIVSLIKRDDRPIV